jgi:hypothetical protein
MNRSVAAGPRPTAAPQARAARRGRARPAARTGTVPRRARVLGASTPKRSPAGAEADLVRRMDAWWRAANYLSVGQIYLLANPLLREARPELHLRALESHHPRA